MNDPYAETTLTVYYPPSCVRFVFEVPEIYNYPFTNVPSKNMNKLVIKVQPFDVQILAQLFKNYKTVVGE